LEGCGKGASLSLGAVRGASFWGGGLRGRTSPHGGPFTGNSDSCKGTLEMGHLSLYGSSVRGTWRGAPLLGALKVMKGRLWGWASLFMGFSWATWNGLIYQGL